MLFRSGDDNTANGSLAWVTGQGSPGGGLGENDVDDGTTSLVSNQIDLSTTQSATISYARWYSNDTGAAPNADVFEVFVSDDDGQTYVPVETVGPAGEGTSGGWIETGFVVGDFVDLTSTIRIKFVASDLGSGSVVEAAIDDVRVIGVSCLDDQCPTDLDGDGSTDLDDLLQLLAAFGNSADGDTNNDGITGLTDLLAVLDAFGQNCE